MKNEERLVKTCIGLVDEYTLLCLRDRAIEVALQADITYEKATEVLLKLAAKGVGSYYRDGKYYFSFDYHPDFIVVNNWINHGTEIVCMYNDEFNVIYKVDEDKYYAEYSDDNYDCYLEEIDI